MTAGDQPRVKANDWSVLDVPAAGDWQPRRSVSIVIPMYRAERTLPYTLAALEAQSYPPELLEVVVVDDGNDLPVRLPEVRPQNTRVVRVSSSWGRANACHEGAHAADGEVIHWLDADMVPCRDEVERHMRWHHAADYAVVLGHKLFVDATDLPSVDAVHDAVRSGCLEKLFSEHPTEEHTWVEKIWRRTSDLTTAGFRAFHVHVGATASVGRALYLEAGEMDPELKLGEDIELGYRLTAKGAVFVAEREAFNWHLGRSTLMRHEQEVQRYNAPFTAERVPDFRKFRQDQGRMYRVPAIEVVVDAADHTFEEVKYTVDGVLQAVPNDVLCVLLGPWSQLRDERRSPLTDAALDLRLAQEEYASEARVAFAETPAPTAFPALFRLHLPTGWRPGEKTMDDLLKDMQKRAHGLRSMLLPDGQVARMERTAAFERASKLLRDGEDLDDVVDEVSTTWWSEGVEDGFLHPVHAATPSSPAPAKAGGDSPSQAPPPRRHADGRREAVVRSVADRGRLRRLSSAVRRRIAR